MQPYQFVVLVPGVLLGAWGLWQRLGRTSTARRWATGHEKARRDAMFSRPFGGLALVMTGLIETLFRWPVTAVLGSVVWVASVVVAFAFGGLLQLPYPRWLEPRWLRQPRSRTRAAESS
ncbi:MAG: hypothetical protein JF565_09530 [Propionibacteriales bacterium]|nr:hypothetical protein [Propionibacteriales bacterium]